MESLINRRKSLCSSGGGGRQADIPRASQEAIAYLESIDGSDLNQMLFDDKLTVSTIDGNDVGEFDVSVSLGASNRLPLLSVKANSTANLDCVPCGTILTARLTFQLDTLEQRKHEYVRLDGCLIDRVTDIIKEKNGYTIYKMVTKGDKQEKTEYSVAAANMKGFISEGADLLLLKLFAKHGVPKDCTFLGLDSNGSISQVTYKQLETHKEKIEDTEMEVTGIARIVKPKKDLSVTWESYFDAEGHLTKRLQQGSPVVMKLLTLPSTIVYKEPSFSRSGNIGNKAKLQLDWENDLELYSKYLDRKEELCADYQSYTNHHAEVKQLMADFIQLLLLEKPDNVVQFAARYFSLYTVDAPANPKVGYRRGLTLPMYQEQASVSTNQ